MEREYVCRCTLYDKRAKVGILDTKNSPKGEFLAYELASEICLMQAGA